MSNHLWKIRDDTEDAYNPDEMYSNNSSHFTLKVFHGGRFTDSPGRVYVNGNVQFVDSVDIENFGKSVLEEMVNLMGYPKDMVYYFHYKVPYVCLDLGLKSLDIDYDFEGLYLHVRRGVKLIELYVEHWHSRVLAQYLNCSSSMTTLINTNEEEVDMGDHDMFNNEDEHDTENEYESSSDNDNQAIENMTGVKVNCNDPDYIVPDAENEDHASRFYENMVNVNVEGEYDDDAKACEGVDTAIDMDDIDINIENDSSVSALRKVIRKMSKKNNKSNEPNNPFYIGLMIESKEKITEMLKSFALKSRRDLYIKKNTKVKFRIVCFGTCPMLSTEAESPLKKINKRTSIPTCPFAIHISRKSVQDTWCVKTLRDEHTCLQTRDVSLYTMSFIAKEIEDLVRANPEIPISALQDLLQRKHQIQVSTHKLFRAKMIAAKKLVGDYKHQYLRLRDYCEELLRSNPGTTIKIDVEPCCNPNSPTRQFRRIYICFGTLKKGFKLLGREILGLDGCFMKGPYPGQILTAVGIDGNNGIYPVAYAIVEAETLSSWEWFLEILGDDLDLHTNSNFTFISDRQKGLVPAITKTFPSAEHRFCFRHIHENMRKQWPGDIVKGKFWNCARATSITHFNREMEEIRKHDQRLHDWLNKIQLSSWSRAHFSTRAKCDVLLNNACEVFNNQLVGARDKPIITCLEFIRHYMTKRIVNVKKLQAKSKGPLTPAATTLFNVIKHAASEYNVHVAGSSRYEVIGPWADQKVVDVDKKTCSCRKWDLTGMPCKHAVAVIWNMSKNDMRVGIPEKWVDEVYWLETWKKAYMCTLDPINGPDLWHPSSCPTTLLPPKHHKQIGRPKKMRKRTVEEVQERFAKGGKMTKLGHSSTCGICGDPSHNRRRCTGHGRDPVETQTLTQNTQSAPVASQDPSSF